MNGASAGSAAALRLARQGVERRGADAEVFCDGLRLSAIAGESVASALTANGVRKFCQSREGDARGIFCGMGVCFDCRVTVDGQAGQRACLTSIRPGMRIETGQSGLPVSQFNAVTDREDRCSVLIVGAGPAGLSAAEAAARSGVDVVLIDERPYPGGQFYKPLASSHSFENDRPADSQYGDGLKLVRNVRKLGVRVFSETLVWDAQAEANGTIVAYTLDAHGATKWTATKLIIATGAFERAWPVPGWTLPGVITTGAAQTLSRSYQTAPGRRVLFAGNGPLNLQVAADLAAAGVKVVAVIEAASAPGLSDTSSVLTMLRYRPGLVWQGLRYLQKLKRIGVRVEYGHVLVRVEGSGRAERAVVAKMDGAGRPVPGTEVAFDVDTVCLGYGFSPSSEIGRLLGCEHVLDRRFGRDLVAGRSADDQKTSNPNIFVAGDAGGPWGAHAAMAQGALAGKAAVAGITGATCVTGKDNRATQLEKEQRFQRALWKLFAAPAQFPANILDSTVVCRCENVEFGAVRRAVAEGASDVPAVKRQTRCGMGRCQGRYCAPVVAKLLEERSRESITDRAFSRIQTPLRPVALRAIAAPQETLPNPGPGKFVSAPGAKGVPESSLLGEADVVVIGGGGVGLFTARELARSGCSVIVVERRAPFSEASGANAGSLHVQFQAFGFLDLQSESARRAALTLPMQVESTYLWKEFAGEADIDIEVEIEGGLTVADDDVSLRHLERKVAIEHAAGLRIDLISGDDARERLPYLSPKIVAASYSPDEGKINPMKAARAVLRNVLAAGVRIDSGTEVIGIEALAEGFVVRADRGHYRASKIVNAAGAWCGVVSSMVGDSMPVRQNPIQMIVTEPTPANISYHLAHARQRLTLKQAAAGNLVIGGGWRASKADDPRAARPTRAGLGGNLAVTLDILPCFGDLSVIRSWTGTAFTTQPIISQSFSVPGVFHVVTQNAMTLAPILGRTAARMVLGQTSNYDLTPFALTSPEDAGQ